MEKILAPTTTTDDLENALAAFLGHPHSQGVSSIDTSLTDSHKHGIDQPESKTTIMEAKDVLQSDEISLLTADLSGTLGPTGTWADGTTILQDVSIQERVVILLGPPNSGKTSFASLILGEDVNSRRISSPIEPTSFQACPFVEGYRKTWLVEAPSFKDNHYTEQVLRDLSHWLTEFLSNSNRFLAAILYFHEITDFPIAGVTLQSLTRFKELFNPTFCKKTYLVTTGWESLREQAPGIGLQREDTLRKKDEFWGSMIKLGSEVVSMPNTFREARAILAAISDAGSAEILIESNERPLFLLPRPQAVASSSMGSLASNNMKSTEARMKSAEETDKYTSSQLVSLSIQNAQEKIDDVLVSKSDQLIEQPRSMYCHQRWQANNKFESVLMQQLYAHDFAAVIGDFDGPCCRMCNHCLRNIGGQDFYGTYYGCCNTTKLKTAECNKCYTDTTFGKFSLCMDCAEHSRHCDRPEHGLQKSIWSIEALKCKLAESNEDSFVGITKKLLSALSTSNDRDDISQHLTLGEADDQLQYYSNRATDLAQKYEQSGAIEHLNEAINIAEQVMKATLKDPNLALRPNFLHNYSRMVGTRYEHMGSVDDLNRAIGIGGMAVNIVAMDHPGRAGYLNNLSTWLGRQFELTGSIDDLNQAIGTLDKLVDASHSDPDHGSYLNNLGVWLGRRFEKTGFMEDLNRAIDVTEYSVSITPPGHADRAMYLSTFGNKLGQRFERTGSTDDLNRAVSAFQTAVDGTQRNNPGYAKYLSGLGIWLGRRFERLGSMDDLDHAIDAAHKTVKTMHQNNPNRAGALINLSNLFGRRFYWVGSMDDLDRAIEAAETAIDRTAQNHPHRSGWLSNLGTLLCKRSERTRSMNDLNRAVDASKTAVDATLPNDPGRAGYLMNLGNRLGRRFETMGSRSDIDRAIDACNTAIDLTPVNEPSRADYLYCLGCWLGRRSERTGEAQDLNRAIEAIEMAVKTIPHDHVYRTMYMTTLGTFLGGRSERTQSMEDIDRALTWFKEGWKCEDSPPSDRILIAQRGSTILASLLRWEEACSLLEAAIKLHPVVSPRVLENNDKQHIVKQFSGLASSAAAICLQAGRNEYQALELLELGRCVIAGLLLEMRTDISDLRQQHPQLAREFETLRKELDSPSNGTTLFDEAASLQKSQATQRFEADKRLKDLIKEIRDQPGFQRFILPPTDEELMAAASKGPIIIINVSSYRCDAFLIERQNIKVLPLPDLTEKELNGIIEQQAVKSVSTLEWLWTVAVGPILSALNMTTPSLDGKWPHVWWIPTGALSHFPIHAAGIYSTASNETVLDRVMSSYSSSVKALVHSRRRSIQMGSELSQKEALLVAMQKTPGLSRSSSLPFAVKEVDMLAKLCPSLKLKAVCPPHRREEVLIHLRACKIFHFAGHGRTDSVDASRSCLLLDDWNDSPLTVADLRELKLQDHSPFLGYLSACSTSANKTNQLVDESIHLASAFQLAGFRHVIGTLWEVSDRHCVEVARILYETLRDEGMTDLAVCRGLHKASMALRDKRTQLNRVTRDAELSDDEGCEGSYESPLESPLYWAPYIHFGV